MALVVGPVLGIFLYTVVGFQMVLFLNAAGCAVAIAALACEDSRFPRRFRRGASSYRKLEGPGFATLTFRWGLLILLRHRHGDYGHVYGHQLPLFPLMTYDHFRGDGYAASLIEAYMARSRPWRVILFIWGGGKRYAWWRSQARSRASSLLLRAFFRRACSSGSRCSRQSRALLNRCNGHFSPWCKSAFRRKSSVALWDLFSTDGGASSPIGLGLAGTCAEFTGVAMWFVISGVVVTAGGLAISPRRFANSTAVAATF